MADLTSLAYGLYALTTAVIFAYVAGRLGGRRVSPSMQTPVVQFALVWACVSAVRAVAAFLSFFAVYQVPSPALVQTMLQLDVLIEVVLLWAFADYLVFLYLGRSYIVPISAAFAVLYVVLQYLVVVNAPYGVTNTYGSIGLDTLANESTTQLLAVSVVAVRQAPLIVGALLYLVLLLRTHDRILRYRIGVVSGALLMWVAASVAVVGAPYWAVFAARAVGLIASILVLIAFFPPVALQRRWGVTPVRAD